MAKKRRFRKNFPFFPVSIGAQRLNWQSADLRPSWREGLQACAEERHSFLRIAWRRCFASTPLHLNCTPQRSTTRSTSTLQTSPLHTSTLATHPKPRLTTPLYLVVSVR